MWLQRKKPVSRIYQGTTLPRWPVREQTVNSLTHLNLRFLDLLAEQAKVEGARIGILRDVSYLWDGLSVEARQRAASCPYLLVDAGFWDPVRWRSQEGRIQSCNMPGFFTVERSLKVAYQVFFYAWHLSTSSQEFEAQLLLGMSPTCMDALSRYTLPQVLELAERSTNWMSPRWPHQVGFWRDLLLAAGSAEFAALETAQMRGLQLLAADIQGPRSSRALPVECVVEAVVGRQCTNV